MSTPSSEAADSNRWVEILDQVEEYNLGNLFRIIKARLKHRRLDGRMSAPLTRINFERGNSVGVLLYDSKNEAVILVRQFRYPVYAGLPPHQQEGEGVRHAWILETVAGISEEGETAQDVAIRELLEEAGYRVKSMQPITTMYPSPGGSSERVTLFLGEVDHTQRPGKGGGLQAEGEDIEVVVIPFTKAMSMIKSGEISDAKAIIALQYLALQKLNAN